MKNFTHGDESKLIIAFTLPVLLGQFFQQIYVFVDRMVVGRYLGENALAAVGASMAIVFAVISLTVGIVMAGTILISQYYGAGDAVNLRKAVDTLNVFLLVAGIGVTGVGIIFSDALLRWMAVPGSILPMSSLFMRWYFTGIIGLFGYHTVAAYLRGVGDSKNPLYILVIASVLNALLVFLFIGVWHQGIAMAAVATVIAQTFAFVLAVIYLHRKVPLLRFRLRHLQFDYGMLKKALWIGFPSGLQQMLVAFGMMTLQYFINQYGINVIAAYTTAGIIETFCLMPALSFSMALIPFTGQNLGAGRIDRVKKGLHVTQKIALWCTVVPSLVVLLFGKEIMLIFNDSKEVAEIGRQYFLIVGAFYMVFTLMFNYSSILRGAGYTWVPMFITLFSLWFIRVPLAYFFSKIWQEKGIFMAIPVSWMLGMVASWIYYKTGKWEKKSIIEKPLMD